MVSRDISEALLDLMQNSHDSCKDLINVVPVFEYDMLEDNVAVNCKLVTRAVVRTAEEGEALRKKVWDAITRRTPAARENNWQAAPRKRPSDYRREY